MVENALAFATKVFDGVEKNGESYIEHTKRVVAQMETDLEKTVAALHDVLQDSDTTVFELEDAGFSKEVIRLVCQLTRQNDTTYMDYIYDCATNDVCRKIKLAEIKDNDDIIRVNRLSFQTYSIKDRRRRSEEILSQPW